MIYIGADHRGFRLKEKIKSFLDTKRIPYMDLGAFSYDRNDDYPDFAALVSKKIENSGKDLGILICGSGVGVCVAANKFKNVRAGTMFSSGQARDSKRDENTNVLCLAADYISEVMAKKIISTWISVRFSGLSRHIRRLNKIKRSR